MRILVVDDEPAIGQLLSSFLSRHGHSVAVAATGKGALDLLDNPASFDLAVIDFTLPDITGLEVANEYLERSGVNVILASGYDIDVSLVAEIHRSRVRSLRKPFMPRMLLQAFES